MSIYLESCPLCGGNNVFENGLTIECRDCGCNTGDQRAITIAVGKWNNRPTEHMARLEGALSALLDISRDSDLVYADNVDKPFHLTREEANDWATSIIKSK